MNQLLRSTVRTAYRRLLPRGARNSLSVTLLMDRQDRAPEPITDFAAPRVLVLAPHMDDETIGCGGSILRHRAAGAAVTVVYTTDGRRGNRSLYTRNASLQEIAAGEAEMAATRREEARAAADVLGISALVFLDGPDGALAVTDALVGGLRKILEKAPADVIYVPSVLDMHQDHWITCGILYAALVEMSRAFTDVPIIRGYEVWMPAFANRVADITEVHPKKIQALQCFSSQLADVDYVRAVEGLSTYRSIHRFQGKGYAEGFHEMTAAEFCALYQRIGEKR